MRTARLFNKRVIATAALYNNIVSFTAGGLYTRVMVYPRPFDPVGVVGQTTCHASFSRTNYSDPVFKSRPQALAFHESGQLEKIAQRLPKPPNEMACFLLLLTIVEVKGVVKREQMVQFYITINLRVICSSPLG